jgi:hypothetical protein
VGISTNAFGTSRSHQEVAGATAGLTDSSVYQRVAAEVVEVGDSVSGLELKKKRHKIELWKYELASGSCIIEFVTAKRGHENDWNSKRKLDGLGACCDASKATLEHVEIALSSVFG